MKHYYVRPTNGLDTNDGRDFHGFALTAGSYDDLGHADGDYRLSETGAFTGYTWVSGDTIYLSGGAGITAGLYAIASKVSNDVILLAESAGSDSTADVTSSNGAWKTFQGAIDNYTLGEHTTIHMCKEGSAPHETISAQVDLDGVNGAAAASVTFMAASGTTGALDPDNGRYTMTWSGTGSRNVWVGSSLGDYHSWIDIEFDWNGFGTLDAWSGVNSAANSHNTFVRCKMRDGGAMRMRSTQQTFFDCLFENAGVAGEGALWLDSGLCNVVGCTFQDSVGHGLECDTGHTNIVNCSFIDSGDSGVQLNGYAYFIAHNVFYGNADHGLLLSGTTTGTWRAVSIFNNSFSKNGAYGIYWTNTTQEAIDDLPLMSLRCDYNHFWNNTSGAAYLQGAAVAEGDVNTTSCALGIYNQTGDPGFTSETDGSEDFTPSSATSVLFKTGLNHRKADGTQNVNAMIGHMLPDPPAGGGGAAAAVRGLRLA